MVPPGLEPGTPAYELHYFDDYGQLMHLGIKDFPISNKPNVPVTEW